MIQKQRRTYTRMKCSVPIVILRDQPRMFSSALMMNYSEDGLYFEISEPIETGAYIMIQTDETAILDPVGCGTWDQRQAEVRWCMAIEESGSHRYGCGVQYVGPSANNSK